MPRNRRQFIRDAALGAGGAALALGTSSILRADPFGMPIGLQLYTVRKEMQKDLEGTLKKVAAIGYPEVELYSFFGKTPAQMKRLLDQARLTAPSGHTTAHDLRENPQAKVDYAKQLGLSYLVCAFPAPANPNLFKGNISRDLTLDDWKWLAGFFNRVGERANQAGIHFCYHGHNFEFRKYDGVVAYDYLLEHTDPQLVNFEMDCYWVSRAGLDPVAYFEKYPGRFPLLHIKDMKPGFAPTTDLAEGAKAFTEVGRGVINWKRIFQYARRAGMKYYFVEQDVCSDPIFQCIKISYEYLHHLQV
jgi:sugar phosphate isomerase/epimerase